ncbi:MULTISPECIES: hypothetical protein [unclassified Streptomyces]|uniref:hypothetical protein n=1 Tax=unclassified Streptomyces TaxID=2593676 RepID=UPI003806B558
MSLSAPGVAEHPLIARFAQIRATAGARFGPASQAVVFLLYEELVSLRSVVSQMHDCDQHPALALRIRELARDIQDRYDSGGMRDAGPGRHQLLCVDPPLIGYDRGVFDRVYRPALAAMDNAARVIGSAPEAYALMTPSSPYVYVVDDWDRLVVWPEPFTLAELVFGRALDRPVEGARVVHPMLVPDRLRVRAAGELVLLGSPEIPMAVANLKSGHFRPPPQCGAVVRSVVRRTLGITDDADIDVFTVPAP